MYVSASLSAERRRLVLSGAAWGCRKSLCPHNRIDLSALFLRHQVFLCLGLCGRGEVLVETGFHPAVMPSIHFFSPRTMAHAFMCGALPYPIHSLIRFVNKLVGTCGRCPPSALAKKRTRTNLPMERYARVCSKNSGMTRLFLPVRPPPPAPGEVWMGGGVLIFSMSYEKNISFSL